MGCSVTYSEHCDTVYVTDYKLDYKEKCYTAYQSVCEKTYRTEYKQECQTSYEQACTTAYTTKYEEKCETRYNEECSGYGYHKKCHKVPYSHCTPVPVQVPVPQCHQVPKEHCRKVPVQVPDKKF